MHDKETSSSTSKDVLGVQDGFVDSEVVFVKIRIRYHHIFKVEKGE